MFICFKIILILIIYDYLFYDNNEINVITIITKTILQFQSQELSCDTNVNTCTCF